MSRICRCVLALLSIVLAVFPPLSKGEGRRRALVIGVSVYDSPDLKSLRTPIKDAAAIGDALKAAQFEVTRVMDPLNDNLKDAIARFVQQIQPGDVALVYFAGHGLQVGEHNYLLPGDFVADQSKLATTAVAADQLLKQIGSRSPALKVLILDACRTNPLHFGSPSGLAEMQASSYGGATYIALAAAPGQTARDGVFASYLAPEISRPGESLGDVFIRVRAQVQKATEGAQTPVSTDQQSISFFFVPAALQDPDDALATLGRVAQAAPSGELGQTKAVEALLAGGRSLAGTEMLRGLSLRSAVLNESNLSQADLTATDFRQASLRGANFSRARLHFANLGGADLSAADVSDASLSFADFSEARLPGAKLANSRWFAADAQGADFSHADLQGASFFLADLRHANFAGANLKNAVMVGSLLKGADFTGAIFSNTDLTDSTPDTNALTAAQGTQACRTPYLSNGNTHASVVGVGVLVIKRIPSTQFSGGFENERAIDLHEFFRLNSVSALPICTHRPNSKQGSVALMQLDNGLEYISTDWSAAYPSQFLDAGGREAVLRSMIDQRFATAKEALKSATVQQVQMKEAKLALPPVNTPQKAPLNAETVLLLILHQHPDLLEKLDWKTLASARARYELDTRNQHADMVWGQFFPEGTYPDQLTPAQVTAFRDWSRARAQHAPAVITMHIQPRRKTVNGVQTLGVFEGQGLREQLFLRSSNIDEKALISFPFTMPVLKLQTDDGTSGLYHFALLLPAAKDRYYWPFSDDQKREVKSRWPQTPWWTPGGDLDLSVKGVLVESQPSLVLIEAQPIQFRMIENKELIFTMNAPPGGE
jgi:uncharacterized protein YjbI with pentapeptide repeats